MAKKKVPFINYTVTKVEDYETLTHMPETKRKVFDRLLESIKDGVKTNKKSVDIFRVYDSDTILILDRDKWKDSLANAIEFYIQVEEYEKCKDCRSLIENI